ncbi:unnamed protein product [Ambrosiozyma monospora]|uniref:Unnamed protein product n=1 Tax=Ambrosiozyma monospora TaxID=43982 RepID=A0ACB5U1E5_AMBMO|nr:unnamed protein product [Ambrosiozyma monospora]
MKINSNNTNTNTNNNNFEDNSVADENQQQQHQHQHQQQQSQQSQQSQHHSESGLCLNSAHEDETSLGKSLNKTMKTPTPGAQNNTISLNDINSNSRRDEMTTIMNQRLDKSLLGYLYNGMNSEAAVRSAKRSPITKEELWLNSRLASLSNWLHGCTVTNADFNRTRYRLERRTLFETRAFQV